MRVVNLLYRPIDKITQFELVLYEHSVSDALPTGTLTGLLLLSSTVRLTLEDKYLPFKAGAKFLYLRKIDQTKFRSMHKEAKINSHVERVIVYI